MLAELTYEQARTCCWNRSTAAMHAIVLDHANAEQADAEAAGMCAAPTVFRAENGTGYQRWADHAANLGRASEWRGWSEDEACAQRAVPEDAISARGTSASGSFCEAGMPAPTPEPTPPPMPEPGDAYDAFGQDDTRATALRLTGPMNAEICAGDEDWYFAPEGGEVTIRFSHARGDLDLEAFDVEGRRSAPATAPATKRPTATTRPSTCGSSGATGTYAIAVR